MTNIESIHNKQFYKLLGNRIGIEETIKKVSSKYENDNIYFELSSYINYETLDEDAEDEEWENFVPKEFLGYMFFIVNKVEPIKKNQYKYLFIDFVLPKDDRMFPLELKIKTLSKNKKDGVCSLEELENTLENLFNSDDFIKITKKMEQMLRK